MRGLTRDFVAGRRSAPIRFRMRAAGGTAGGKTMAMECGSDTRLVARGVIRPFADKRTAAIWADRTPKGFPERFGQGVAPQAASAGRRDPLGGSPAAGKTWRRWVGGVLA